MWGFGTIANNSNQQLLVGFAIDPGGTCSAADLNGLRGNAVLEVSGLGAIYFTDIGRAGGRQAVDVQCGSETRRWFYDEDGSLLDAMISDDGTFMLTGQGQTITGRLPVPPAPAVPPPVAAVSAQ